MHACDDEEASVVGPVKLDPTSNKKSQPVFFFANQAPLETERYEFHKNHESKVSNSSFIYMLYEIEDVSLDMIANYLEPQKPDSIDIANTETIVDIL